MCKMKDKLINIRTAIAVMILAVLVPVSVMTLLFMCNFPIGRKIMPAFLGSLVLVAVVCVCCCAIAIRLPHRSRNLLVLAASYMPFVLFVVIQLLDFNDLDLSIFMLSLFFLYFLLQFFLFSLNARYAETMTHLLLYNSNTIFCISMSYAVSGLGNMVIHFADFGSKLLTMYSYYITAGVGLLFSLIILFSSRKRLAGKI